MLTKQKVYDIIKVLQEEVIKMDYELIWWCVCAICLGLMLCGFLFVRPDTPISKETLDRLNGKRSRDNYIRQFP